MTKIFKTYNQLVEELTQLIDYKKSIGEEVLRYYCYIISKEDWEVVQKLIEYIKKLGYKNYRDLEDISKDRISMTIYFGSDKNINYDKIMQELKQNDLNLNDNGFKK